MNETPTERMATVPRSSYYPSATIAYLIREQYDVDFGAADLELRDDGRIYIGSSYFATWDGETLTLDRKTRLRRVTIRPAVSADGRYMTDDAHLAKMIGRGCVAPTGGVVVDQPSRTFEDGSPLYYSNDKRLEIQRENTTAPRGFVVVDTSDQHVELFTMNRQIAEAFVAGYDYRERLDSELRRRRQNG